MALDPGTKALLDLIEQSDQPKLHEGDPEVGRQAMRAMTCDPLPPEQVVPVHSVQDATVAGRPARIYRPAAGGGRPTVLYLHGGGYVIGDLDTHDQTCRRLANDADAVVVSLDYRLAPEHPFPAGYEDALAAAAWVAARLDELGGSSVLGAAGDSAGGNLAAGIAQAMPERIAAQLLLYPATDAEGDYPSRRENGEGYFLDQPTLEWFLAHYLGGAGEVDAADPRLSPLRGDLAGQPPAVIATAEFDPLRDEGEAYAEALRAAGGQVDLVRYSGLVHGFADMGLFSPAALEAVADVHQRFAALLHD